ncbi:SDR family NAD(P)-dependent oxidoreductase [uncultured Roseicyclus sp.]|jgi:NAD(P)-dependent dehydrogenase (short-subunit alcohol dehydrogenase family)|uniref:SDR family NAD(P)-dependent oxidoreductase n=1 Tax=uncultured Roseicyclus sp. TaxID=543072 RepID=UPI0026210CAB|nr:SDR family NAD(P)-dependent oxidoreductase [uncultured Roseicyclus sp.]
MTGRVLITGCSSGIGRAACAGLRARGWTVIASARAPEDLDRLRADGFAAVRIDHHDSASIAAGFAEAVDLAGGRIEALFNNAGHGMPGAAEDLPRGALEEVFSSNVFGLHDLTCHAIRHMRAHGGGRIVQHSSVVGFTPLRWRAAYVATKHALEGLTNTMRVELRGTGIHVAILNTGPVTSGFRDRSMAQFDRWIDVDASRHAQFYRTKWRTRREAGRDRFELGPEAVVKKLAHALESRSPRRRYYITTPAYVAAVLTRILPDAAQDWIVSRL